MGLFDNKSNNSSSSNSAQGLSNIAGGALSAVSGVTGILDTSLQMAQAPDISSYENQIDQMGIYRDGKTWDMNQLMEQRNSVAPVSATYGDIGGISDLGIAGGTLSAAAQGAMTGLTVGGPWGALIGAVVGTGAGLAGGLVGRRKAKDQVLAINRGAEYQRQLNDRYFNLQADKITDYNYGNLFANRAAKGGEIHIKKSNKGKFTAAAKRNHMSVQEFAKHVLSAGNKGKYSATMRKRANFARNAAGWKHAEGGQIETISDMEKFNTHGGYYAPDNLVRINTGGTHEQNPNGGVQYGMDQQGIPNLVEENENIYNDYVFSERIKATSTELKRFGLPEKYEGMSFSKIADKLSEEARQRPNDAVSANGMGAMLDRLQACQEDHKARLEQSRMRRELNNMSPEELMALGAQMAQQPTEISQEQVPMQEAQPMVEAPMMQQEMPMEQAPIVAAEGGNLYKFGGFDPFLTKRYPKTGIESIAARMAYKENYPGFAYPVTFSDRVRAAARSDKEARAKRAYDTMKKVQDSKVYQALDWVDNKALGDMFLHPYYDTREYNYSDDVYACGGKMHKYDDGGILLPYVEEDPTTRAMQHFDERQARNDRIIGAVDTFFNGPDNVIGDPGVAGWISPANAAALPFLARTARNAGMAVDNAAIGIGKWAKGRREARAVSKVTADVTKATGKTLATKYDGLISEANALNKEGKYEEASKKIKEAKEISKQLYETESLHNKAWRQRLRIFPSAVEETRAVSPTTTAATTATASAAAETKKKGSVWPWIIGATTLTGVGAGVNALLRESDARGSEERTPIDSRIGTYERGSGSKGAYVDGYADGGRLVRRYDWPGYLGYGPITTSIYTPPQYEGEYSYFTDNPIHTTGKVEWVRHPAGQGAVPEVVVENPAAVEYDGPLMRDGRYAVAQTRSGNASGPRRKASVARTKVDALPSVAGRLAPGLVAANNKYGFILAAPESTPTSKIITETPSGAVGAGTPVVVNKTTATPVTTSAARVASTYDPAALPTWMRYAGALGNAGLAMYNAFQEPDKLNLGPIKPVFINGRLALQRQRYNPLDQQSMVNPVLANTAAGYRAINDSGLGASTGSAMIAAMNAGNQGIGAATTQGRLYNDQLLSNVIQQNNAAEQAEANFYNRINTANAQIANNAILQNYYGNMRQQMYNNEAETAKWNAVSQALDASLTDLSNIGRENFMMNQANSNTALLGYGVDKRGWNHYRTPDGYEVIVNPATEQIVDIKEASGTALSEARRKEIEAIVRQQIAAEKEPKYQLLKA